MKAILILCVLQMIFLAFLAKRLIHIEDQLNQVDSNSAPLLAGATTQVTDPIEDARRLDAARQTLGYYIKRGEITDIEMQEFQTEISRLEPESRTMLLRALVHALNSGDLKGRL